MLNKAVIKNFGPLPNGEYRFASGLNVVVGENAGSKAAKAEELGLPILDEDGFVRLLESGLQAAGEPAEGTGRKADK